MGVTPMPPYQPHPQYPPQYAQQQQYAPQYVQQDYPTNLNVDNGQYDQQYDQQYWNKAKLIEYGLD